MIFITSFEKPAAKILTSWSVCLLTMLWQQLNLWEYFFYQLLDRQPKFCVDGQYIYTPLVNNIFIISFNMLSSLLKAQLFFNKGREVRKE